MSFLLEHKGHDVKRGPLVSLKGTDLVCLDCHLFGTGKTEDVFGFVDFSENDYWENIYWIEEKEIAHQQLASRGIGST